MIYYRVAWKNSSGSTWQWKSTKLSSIDALFRFLELYGVQVHERLRVFSSSSAEGLNELLEQKNRGFETDSLSVEEFLRRHSVIAIGNSEAKKSGKEEQENRADRFPRGVLGGEERASHYQHVDDLQSRRIAFEQGKGGDHDIPYTFTLPVSLPQILTWTSLLAKVQHGELEL